ncbi:MAG: uridine phosphorylase [Candidatus Obscuribacterales bacterium]|nr:uridine phosphorylase [Candidatus Obscuribacterales bacterium]
MTKHAHHLQLDSSMIEGATVALLPGDPGRVPLIAAYLDNSKELAFAREFRSFLGEKNGVKVLVTSTGCGGPSLSVCVEELAQIGLRTFIRVGTTGSIQEHIEVGDLVISNAAVRLDGASKSFAPIEYPAVSDITVTNALIKAASEMQVRFHVGITASTDTFYQGQERYDSYTGFVPEHLRGSRAEWQALKVANFEMESATLFTMCSTMGLRAGTVCGAVAKRTVGEKVMSREAFKKAEEETALVAVNAAVALASALQPVE